MSFNLIDIGFGNVISAQRIMDIVSPDSASVKRSIAEAKTDGRLIDATYGRRTRAVILTDSSHVVLVAVAPEIMSDRLGE